MTKIKLTKGHVVGLVALAFMAGLTAFAYFTKTPEVADVPYAEFVKMAEGGNVSRVTLGNGAQLKFTAADGRECRTDNPRNPLLKETLLLQGVSVDEGGATYSVVQGLMGVLCAAALFYMVTRGRGEKAAFAMDAQAVSESGKTAAFDDVAGNEEAKADVADVVDFIKTPDKYAAYGARIPRGLIFYGPPGTGKTLMARAVAGEAGVPFFAVSGSDFVQMYVGVGAARVRDLFRKARAAGRAVIFIDEIDALAKKRAANVASANDERDQTLNALLSEMSGFNVGDGIVVIAATNRIDTLDEALLRPGRFDRHIEIGLPDMAARKRILALHAANKPLADGVDMDGLARQTALFSGAMLENLLNEAAIRAAKDGAGGITPAHIDAAYYIVLAGSPKAAGADERARQITARHEAGHALAARILLPSHTVAKVTIIPSTKGAGGFCVNVPPERAFVTKKELEGEMMVSLAGRAAEELAFGADDVTTGAANDLEKAARLARDYAEKFGMSAAGLYAADEKELGRVCADVVNDLYGRVKQLLEAEGARLEAVTAGLLERESLDGAALDALIA